MGISQEDIDNLVEDKSTGADAPPEEAGQGGTDEDVRGKYQSGFASHLTNIFATLTGVDVKAEPKDEQIANASELGTILSGDWLGSVCRFEFGSNIPTGHLITKPLANIIVGKIMGQDPPEILGDEHLGAFKEALGNLIGAWTTELGEILHTDVKPAGDPELQVGEIGSALAGPEGINGDKAVVWSYTLTIGDSEGEYKLVIPEKPLKEMVMAHPEYSVDSPAQATQPAAEAEAPAAEDEAAAAEDEAAAPAPSKEKQEVSVEKAVFQPFEGPAEVGSTSQIELLLDVPLMVSVELGRKRLSIREVLDMVPGSLLELEKLAGEPVDLMVNGKLFAHGEVVVIDESFGIRVSNIVSREERLERLK